MEYLRWVRDQVQEVVADAKAHDVEAADIPDILGRRYSLTLDLIAPPNR